MGMCALDNMDPQHVATAALQAFFNITGQWSLSEKQQRKLLGQPDESTLNARRLMPGYRQRGSACNLGGSYEFILNT